MSEHKVKEAAAEARKAKLLQELEQNPDNVIFRSEVIFGAISVEDGKYGIQCGEYPSGLVKQVSYDLLFRSMMLFQHMEFAKAMKEQSEKKIVTLGG